MQNFFTRLISWVILLIMTAFGYGIRGYTENAFRIPGLEDGFVPQGISQCEDLFYISGYFNDKTASRVYVVRAQDGVQVACAALYNTDDTPFLGHAGGIVAVGEYVYVASGNSLWVLSREEVLAAQGDAVRFLAQIPTNVKASFAFYAENTLWVGEFHLDPQYDTAPAHHGSDGNNAWVMGYALDEFGLPFFDENDQMKPTAMFTVPDKVQGMTILPDGTVVASLSYGRHNTSYLVTYARGSAESVCVDGVTIPKYSLTDSKRDLKLRLPPMAECIDFYDGKVYILFESGATVYADASQVVPYVWKTDLVALLQKLREGIFA